MVKERTVEHAGRLFIAAVLFEALEIGNRPFVFPVVDNADFGRRVRADDFIELCQILAESCHFTEHTRVFAALMVDHCAVEFFGSTARFAPLEILNGVRTMRHRLQGGKPVHSRTFHLVNLCPVDTARRAFHEHKRTA